MNKDNNIQDFIKLESDIGYIFKNRTYLTKALTHSSFNKAKKHDNNERMEFLGDRILGFIIAEELYNKFNNDTEEVLSKCLSYITSADVICKIAKVIQLENYIKKNNEPQDSIIVDACEALIAAIYLDSGSIDSCKDFILKYWGGYIKSYSLQETYIEFNPKSFVQEWAQNKKLPIPHYICHKKEGTEHNPIFCVDIIIKDFPPVTGVGNNKKNAEKNAATIFITKYIKKDEKDNG